MMRENELYHHGIKGQKWGVKRFHNSSTAASRYSRKIVSAQKAVDKNNARKESITAAYNKNSVKNASREARLAKLKEKRNAMTPRVQKTLAAGNRRGAYKPHERLTLRKAARLDKKIARLSKPKLRYDTKISKLDAKNAKLEKRVKQYLDKYNKATGENVQSGKDVVEAVMGG